MSPGPADPSFRDVSVPGGELRVAQWGEGGHVVLGVHGITASSQSWLEVARHLEPGTTLVAPDLRGRGGSAGLPGPYGLRAHALDLVAVLDDLGVDAVTVAGHSLGAYVAVVLAGARPDRVEELVLVDGGLPLSVPAEAGLDVDAVLAATLGPALARLRMTFASVDTYFDFWRDHPAVGECWSEDVEAYLAYELVGEAPELRPSASESAVRADGADVLLGTELLEGCLRRATCPVTLLRATRGLLNEPAPMLPDVVVDRWKPLVSNLHEEVVPDTNHYSIVLDDRAAAFVATVLARTSLP